LSVEKESLQTVGSDTGDDQGVVGTEVWKIAAETRCYTYAGTEKEVSEEPKGGERVCVKQANLLATLLGFEIRLVSINSAKGRRLERCSWRNRLM